MGVSNEFLVLTWFYSQIIILMNASECCFELNWTWFGACIYCQHSISLHMRSSIVNFSHFSFGFPSFFNIFLCFLICFLSYMNIFCWSLFFVLRWCRSEPKAKRRRSLCCQCYYECMLHRERTKRKWWLIKWLYGLLGELIKC